MMLAGGADPTNCVWRRVVAYLADGFIVVLLASLVVAYFQIDLYRSGPLVRGIPTKEYNPAALPIYVAAELFFEVLCGIFLVGARGWSPGKLIMGLRVVGWDGRAPGLGRAFVRGISKGFLSGFGCFYWITGLALMNISKGHKAPPDMLAGTYVIDSSYWGRMIVESQGKVMAGPKTASRETVEMVHAQRAQQAQQVGGNVAAGVAVPKGARSTEPFYDKARDTYVVYRPKEGQWMQLDKVSGQWNPLQ